MILEVFTLHDSKVGTYSQPFFARSIGEATRIISNTVASGESHLSRNPEDFSLLRLGTFDDASARFECGDPQSFGTLVQFMPKPKGVPPLLAAMEGGKS